MFSLLVVGLFLPMFICAEVNLSDSFSKILTERHSGYKYDSSRAIRLNEIKEILKAGRLAPSSYNEQPWNFIVCDSLTNPGSFNKALDALVEFNQNWAKDASILIIIVASNKSANNNKINEWALYDTGASAFAMMLKATSMGFMAHQMGGFDPKKLSVAFRIPEDYQPISVMAIGYASEDQIQSERKRKPFNENFFNGSWGKSY